MENDFVGTEENGNVKSHSWSSLLRSLLRIYCRSYSTRNSGYAWVLS